MEQYFSVAAAAGCRLTPSVRVISLALNNTAMDCLAAFLTYNTVTSFTASQMLSNGFNPHQCIMGTC